MARVPNTRGLSIDIDRKGRATRMYWRPYPPPYSLVAVAFLSSTMYRSTPDLQEKPRGRVDAPSSDPKRQGYGERP